MRHPQAPTAPTQGGFLLPRAILGKSSAFTPMIHPTLHDALLSGVTAIATTLATAAVLYLNPKLLALRPDAQRVARILSTMDAMLMGRKEITIAGLDVLALAIDATNKVAQGDGITEGDLLGLARRAVAAWRLDVFQEKLNGGD